MACPRKSFKLFYDTLQRVGNNTIFIIHTPLETRKNVRNIFSEISFEWVIRWNPDEDTFSSPRLLRRRKVFNFPHQQSINRGEINCSISCPDSLRVSCAVSCGTKRNKNNRKYFANEGRISADFFSLSSYLRRFKNSFLFCLRFERFVMSFAFIIVWLTTKREKKFKRNVLDLTWFRIVFSFDYIFKYHECRVAKNKHLMPKSSSNF